MVIVPSISFKKILVVFIAAFALTGCNNEAKVSKDTTTAVKAENVSKKLPENVPVITVATQADYPPFDFFGESGKFAGFDVDVINAVATNQGMSVNMINVPWQVIFTGLDKKEYDVVIGAMAPTPERAAKYALTESYAKAPNSVVVLEDSPIKRLSELNGRTVGLFLADNAYNTDNDLKANGIVVNPKGQSSTWMLLKDLMKGETEAAIVDRLVALYHMKNIPNQKFRFIELPSLVETDIVMAARDRDLADKLNLGLANIKENGTYDEIYIKWFGENK